MEYLGGVGQILAQTLIGLVLFVLVLRVTLPLAGARFRNPICQLVYRITNPVMAPLTRLIPNYRNISVSGVLLTWVAACIGIALLIAFSGSIPSPLIVALVGFGTVIYFVLSVAFWMIIIRALLSFLSPDMSNPAVEVLFDLTDPILRLFRNLPPKLQGIDLSPLWACLVIRLVQYTLHYIGLPGLPF